MRYKMLSFEDAAKAGFDKEILDIYGYNFTHGVFIMENDIPIKILGYDGGAPEDQLLFRDWKWVVPALNEAYEAGLHDGASNPYA